MCLSNDETEALRTIIRGVRLIEADWSAMAVAKQKRAASAWWFPSSLAVVEARDARVAGAVRARVAELANTHGGLAPVPMVTGDDLVALGLRPGPAFKRALEEAYDAQLEGRVADRAAAVEMAKRTAGGA
jgi:poly(A) polymerase